MRKLLVLMTIFSLWGCGNTQPEEIPAEKNEVMSLNENATFEAIETVAKGEACGGELTSFCKKGLECQVDKESLDGSGVCVESVEQADLECPKAQRPVCAIKNGTKNGYTSECEAIRHGATVIADGFCEVDPAVAGNCEATFIPMGICATDIEGVSFDAETNTCIKKTAKACDADIPFTTVEECQSICLGGAEKVSLLEACPEERIQDKMPGMADVVEQFSREYFIYEGVRREIKEFDEDYLKENCEIKTIIVS